MAASFRVRISLVLLLCAGMAAARADDDDEQRRRDRAKSPAVSIASPAPWFATNATTLPVSVLFRLRDTKHRDRNVTRLRLWLDGRVAGTYDIPHGVEKGTRNFALDLSTRAEGLLLLHADLIRVKKHKKHDERDHVLEVSRPVAGLVDRTPPSVQVVAPADHQIVGEAQATLRGVTGDALSGVVSVTLNGGQAPLAADGSFTATIDLPFNSNTVDVTATDRAGNSTSIQHHIVRSAELLLQPAILTVPPVVALVGMRLEYRVAAASPNPGALEYSLAIAPAGMALDAAGLLTWTPTADQVGEHAVIIKVRDADGETSQSFRLSVFGRRLVSSVRISARAGGVISVDDPASSIHGLSVAIPPDALLADTNIEVSEVLTPPTLAGTPRFFLRGVVIEPDGTLLSAPATIRLPYDPGRFGKGQGLPLEGLLTAYFADPASGSLEALPAFSVDRAGRAIVGSVSHFSVYAFTNGARLCPPPTRATDCPDTIEVAPERSAYRTALMVHGFQPGGLGDESTWGQLRTLLGRLDSGARGRVDAWRFDWDSAFTPFEMSAGSLAEAIARIRDNNQSELDGLNVVAHSFGGLLVRTYLQNRANFGALHYRPGDIHKVLTIGTPHQGIGGPYSQAYADGCASLRPGFRFTTCAQVNSGNPRTPQDGSLIRSLTPVSLPVPLHVIIGQVLGGHDRARLSGFLADHDGLITRAGASLPEAASTETLAQGNSDPLGLCHSSILFEPLGSCVRLFGNGQRNIAMAEVDDKRHAVWPKVCGFLGLGERDCKPRIDVFRLLGGVVTSVPQGIDCGPTCSAGFDPGTELFLTAAAQPGYKFDGWGGACSGSEAQCVLTTRHDDQFVIATFSEVAGTPVEYSFAPISLPGAPTSIGFTGIAFNTSGDVVWPVRPRDSYLRVGAELIRFTVAGATISQAQALAINDRREIAGVFCDSALEVPFPSGGVVDSCRIFVTSVDDVLATPEIDGTRVVVPRKVVLPAANAYWFNPNGINNDGDIVGFYQPAPDAEDTGFLLGGAGGFSAFRPGGARFTYPSGLNDARDSVGYACPDNSPCAPFLRRGDGSAGVVPAQVAIDADYAGINNAGLIVGNYWSGSGSSAPGFLVSGSEVIDLPAFGEGTQFLGINNAGQLLGSNRQGHFIATPRR